jgi:histidinol-phosphate aminotransferase
LLQPNPNIAHIPPNIHGGIDYREAADHGIPPESLLDFSVNCNPFGPPPQIFEALSGTSVDSYPDSESTELRQALAAKLNISPDNIIMGSGSTELIRLVALAYFSPARRVLIPQPTYGEYEIACHLVSAGIIKQPADEKKQFRIDIDETVELVKKHRPHGIFLCNPNNPTGQYLTETEIGYLLQNTEDCLVLLDEAYIAFTDEIWSSTELMKQYQNLFIFRSMTKDYALAGLRLGYGMASESVISVLNRIKPPWNVTVLSQKAGKTALQADEYIQECSLKIHEAKTYLFEELTSLGFKPVPSQSNFFLVKTGNVAEFRRILMEKGILVRDCTSFGLPDYIRLAPRTMPECQKLIDVIKEVKITSHVS